MKLRRLSHSRGEGGIALLIIVLAIIGGIVWFLYSSRKDADRDIRAFAQLTAQKIAVDFDDVFLRNHLNPEYQITHPPSWRARLFDTLHDYGQLTKPIETTGDVQFSSQFYDPHGTFRSTLAYPASTEHLEITISKGMSGWRIDEVTIAWNPKPVPTPSPSAAMTATPTPSPTPPPAAPPLKQKRKKGG
jgi:hypothetical protein